MAKAKLRDAHKLVFSSDNLVWVLGNWPGSTTEVFAIELSQASGGEGPSRRRQEHSGSFYGQDAQVPREAFLGEGLAPDLRSLRSLPTQRKLRDALQRENDQVTKRWIARPGLEARM